MENKGEFVISEPYVSAITNEIVVTISQTINDGSGIVAVDINLNYLQSLTNQVNIGETGYAILLDKSKNYIAHPTEEPGDEATASLTNLLYVEESGQIELSYDGEQRVMAFVTNELTGWKLAGLIASSEITEAALPILKRTILIIGIALILGTLSVVFITKSIITPIVRLIERAITISEGDLT